MKWEAVLSAASRAYGGESSAAGKAAANLVRLVQHRGLPLPAAHPQRLSEAYDNDQADAPAITENNGGSGMVGLVASRPICQGEIVVEVPPTVWIPHSAAASLAAARENVPAFVDAMARLDDTLFSSADNNRSSSGSPSTTHSVAPLAALAMQVLFCAAPSPDDAYLRWLHHAVPPQDVAETMPAFWGPSRLSHLQGAAGMTSLRGVAGMITGGGGSISSGGGSLSGGGSGDHGNDGGERDSVGGSIGRLPSLAQAIHASLFGSASSQQAPPPVSLLLYALCLVQSRATNNSSSSSSSSSSSPLSSSSSGASSQSFPFSMVPYFDLLNHSLSPNCIHSFDAATQTYVVSANTNIAAGEECTISYGHLSNASLLRLYGFTIENPSSSPSAGSSASSSSSSRTSSSSSSSSSSYSSSSALSSPAFSSAASLLSGSAPLNLNIEELAAATTTTTVSYIDSVVSNVTTTNTINTSNSPTAAEAEATQGQQQQQQQLDAFCEAAAALNPSDLLLPSLQSPMPSKRLYDLALTAAKADLIPHNPTLGRGGGRGGGGGGDLREMGDESVEDFEGNAAAGSNKHDVEGSSTAAAAAAANAWLLGGVDSQLASYETSLLEDEALLLLADDTACRQKAEGGSKKTGRLPLWQRHCVVVRSGEKRVLHAGREALLVELSK